MTNIDILEANKLRAITGVGIMSCKKSLDESNGDFNKAIEILRKSGEKINANCSYNEFSEGVAVAVINNSKTEGVAITLKCENNYTSKNQIFISLATEFANIGFKFDNKEDLIKEVNEKIIKQSAIFDEKIEIGHFEKLKGNFIGSYIHTGNKIAVLTAISNNIKGVEEVAKNVAMQCASMNPIALNENSIDTNIVAKEIEIIKCILEKEKKPEVIIDKIIKGKFAHFVKENTLLNQNYIKDNKLTIESYVKSIDRNLTITGFKRVCL